MPNQIEKVINAKNLVLGFAAIVTAASVWSIWGGDIFPPEPDPIGDPTQWATEELKRWLRKRDLLPDEGASREALIERVHANMRTPRSA
ncbi:hypothetical protein VTN31DRAFT_4506 [Thermomyces dupontii]|uniref:uncharacterized protein n=1 Tax=Talaromyces thermophilus TaxID=28565 RepID=UPI003742BDA7